MQGQAIPHWHLGPAAIPHTSVQRGTRPCAPLTPVRSSVHRMQSLEAMSGDASKMAAGCRTGRPRNYKGRLPTPLAVARRARGPRAPVVAEWIPLTIRRAPDHRQVVCAEADRVPAGAGPATLPTAARPSVL